MSSAGGVDAQRDARNLATARAFSGHRFEEAFGALAPEARWRLVGATTLEGREAIVAACRGTLDETVDVTTTWLRFVATGGGSVVAVDAVGRYDGPDGTAVVSSCDVYEFDGADLRTITSYTVEIDPDDAEADARVEAAR